LGILRIGRFAMFDAAEPMVKRVGPPFVEGRGTGAPKGDEGVEEVAAPKGNPPTGRLLFTAAGDAG